MAERRQRWEAEHRQQREAARHAERARSQGDAPSTWRGVSRCIGDAIDDDTIVVNEYDLDTTQSTFTQARAATSPVAAVGGLGWGLGAALGAKLAAPDKTIDRAAWATAPTSSARRPPSHLSSRAHNLPVLFVIFNNRAWNAVKRSVHLHAPAGLGGAGRTMPLTELEPAPDYELIARASGGTGPSAWRTRPCCRTCCGGRCASSARRSARPCST